jgi:hypothetical protein
LNFDDDKLLAPNVGIVIVKKNSALVPNLYLHFGPFDV